MASVTSSEPTSGPRSTGSRRAKSAGAFRTISEVADELDVAQHVLRFWESKFPQVRPLKRGGGRRYYRPEDVDLLNRIRSLLYDEGYTIKGAQKLLKGQRRAPTTDRPAPDSDGRSVSKDTETREAMVDQTETEPSHYPLETDQKEALIDLRSELTELRDNLRKFTS